LYGVDVKKTTIVIPYSIVHYIDVLKNNHKIIYTSTFRQTESILQNMESLLIVAKNAAREAGSFIMTQYGNTESTLKIDQTLKKFLIVHTYHRLIQKNSGLLILLMVLAILSKEEMIFQS